MNWALLFVVSIYALNADGQRRAHVHYSLTTPEDEDSVSANPLSSSINSIPTGREELHSHHRSDTGLRGLVPRSHQRTTTTPDYIKDSFVASVYKDVEKHRYEDTGTRSSSDTSIRIHIPGNLNDNSGRRTDPHNVSTDTSDTEKLKDKVNSRSGSSSNTTTAEDPVVAKDLYDLEKSARRTLKNVELDHTHTEGIRPISPKSDIKESMDVNKDASVRQIDRMNKANESRSQRAAMSPSSSSRFNSSGRPDEFTDMVHHDRDNRDKRPAPHVEIADDQGKKPTRFETTTPRIVVHDIYHTDRQPSLSTGSRDVKTAVSHSHGRDPFVTANVRTSDLDEDKEYSKESDRTSDRRQNRTSSSAPNKSARVPAVEERGVDATRTSGTYGSGSRSSRGEDTDRYSEDKRHSDRHYTREDFIVTGKSTGHRDRDSGRDYSSRTHRDRYEDRLYEDRPPYHSHRDSPRDRHDVSSKDSPRSYDDYVGTDRYRDDYNRRYQEDDESRRYGENGSRRYAESGSRRYDTIDEYDRSRRRYADDDYKYSDTRKYRDRYDGYDSGSRRGDSGYYSTDRSRDSRYDDETSRSYRTSDPDRKHIAHGEEDSTSPRDSRTRNAAVDDSKHREDDAESRYRVESREYRESIPKDAYDAVERTTSGSKKEDEYARRSEGNDSRRTRGDQAYSSRDYDESGYRSNRDHTSKTNHSTLHSDRYDDETERSRPKTDDRDYSSYERSGEERTYKERYDEGRRADRDRTYDETTRDLRSGNRDTRRDRVRDDYESDRSRTDSRYEDDHIHTPRHRTTDYASRSHWDGDEDGKIRDLHIGTDSDGYKSERSRPDRVPLDENTKADPSSLRARDSEYFVDRRHEDRRRDRNDGREHRYRTGDDRYKPEESERRNKGSHGSHDYDSPSDRGYSSPRSADESAKRSELPRTRDDHYVGVGPDFPHKHSEKESSKTDGVPALRNVDSRLDKDRHEHDRRDGERKTDGVRTDSATATVGSDKGDFGRGRRTSFYNEDDKAVHGRDDIGSTEDKYISKHGKDDHGLAARPSSTSDIRPQSVGGVIPPEREGSGSSRHRIRDHAPTTSRNTSDPLHASHEDPSKRHGSSAYDKIPPPPNTRSREKHFHGPGHSRANDTFRSQTSVHDEPSRRPLTTKEVIEADYRHSAEPEKQGDVHYPVSVPNSSSMTSPDIIRPSERRGLTTPTKKKK